jgi:hypothetical protein
MIQIEIPHRQLISALLCTPVFCPGFCFRHVYLFLERFVVDNIFHRNCCFLSVIVPRRIKEKKRGYFGFTRNQGDKCVRLAIIPGLAGWNVGILTVFTGKTDVTFSMRLSHSHSEMTIERITGNSARFLRFSESLAVISVQIFELYYKTNAYFELVSNGVVYHTWKLNE